MTRTTLEPLLKGLSPTNLNFEDFASPTLTETGPRECDLLAVSGDRILQVQVKGATHVYNHPCVLYGVCTEDIIQDRKQTMFNRHSSFYKADIVVLVAVNSPREYSCVVFPVEDAEQAEQLNLDREFRTLTQKGTPHKPHKVWAFLDHRPTTKDPSRQPLLDKEAELLGRYKDNWAILEQACHRPDFLR